VDVVVVDVVVDVYVVGDVGTPVSVDASTTQVTVGASMRGHARRAVVRAARTSSCIS